MSFLCHLFYRSKYLTSQYLNRKATKSSIASPVRNVIGRGMSTLLNWAVSYASSQVFHLGFYLCQSPVLHSHADDVDFANTAWLRESTKYLKKPFRKKHHLWANLPTPMDTSWPACTQVELGRCWTPPAQLHKSENILRRKSWPDRAAQNSRAKAVLVIFEGRPDASSEVLASKDSQRNLCFFISHPTFES